ncbi:MAG: hypothetical protein LBN33_09575 [Desulfovibrio sp.]|jgi:hypothetical protein|nr:hypothetical protein [Desulfovibrio sp.]
MLGVSGRHSLWLRNALRTLGYDELVPTVHAADRSLEDITGRELAATAMESVARL